MSVCVVLLQVIEGEELQLPLMDNVQDMLDMKVGGVHVHVHVHVHVRVCVLG